MPINEKQKKLALYGGPSVRDTPFPDRSLLGPEEKAAVDALFDKAIAEGSSIGYNTQKKSLLQRVCKSTWVVDMPTE